MFPVGSAAPTASEATIAAFLTWFEASESRPYAAMPSGADYALRLADPYIALGYTAAPGDAAPEYADRADGAVDALYKQHAAGDHGDTFGPTAYPTRFLARLIENRALAINAPLQPGEPRDGGPVQPDQALAGDGGFRDELAAVINRYSRENTSNTPDFLLAEYLDAHLVLIGDLIRKRDEWYGRAYPDMTTA
jgi:hypothetical protein